MMQPPRKQTRSEDRVWVDCFYYGFYIDKDKVSEYQTSLKPSQRQPTPQRH